jgi:hypothetical protein
MAAPLWKDGRPLSGLAEEHFEGGLDALEADLAAIAAEDVAFR